MDDHHEEVEHIPWGELLASHDDGRRRALYLAAGALGALVLGVVVTRALSSPAPPQPEPAPVAVAEATTTTVPPAPITVVVEVPATDPPTTTTSSLPAPVLYTEADLMAFPFDLGARAAVARAEWFVTDYFTADLEPNGTADLRGALPVGVVLPEMPQDAAIGLSYVEWARALRVEEDGDGSYRVMVAYRLLGAPPEQGFQRLAVRAVEVRVAVSDSGGSVVLDLPSPVALPAGPTPQPWPTEGEIPSQVVVDGAMGEAAGWGSEHRLLGTFRVAGGWRVMLSAADELGNRWPLVVYVDDSGTPLR
ncbi:MAG: hypothetical protein KJ956_00075 [Actinobacteria bacterium]|nr:hypothetical protein [Actinomycetota bacterium]